MGSLDSIPVSVEGVADQGFRTENLRPLLRQIEQALTELVETGAESTIDLGAMPFSDQDEQDLRAHLGQGEINATLQAFGPTLVQETGFPGIWLVEHQDAERRRLTLHLEITRIPAILTTPVDDLADSLNGLSDSLHRPPAPTEDVE